jgi:hypothetical protein
MGHLAVRSPAGEAQQRGVDPQDAPGGVAYECGSRRQRDDLRSRPDEGAAEDRVPQLRQAPPLAAGALELGELHSPGLGGRFRRAIPRTLGGALALRGLCCAGEEHRRPRRHLATENSLARAEQIRPRDGVGDQSV